jgi:hypothetical protein
MFLLLLGLSSQKTEKGMDIALQCLLQKRARLKQLESCLGRHHDFVGFTTNLHRKRQILRLPGKRLELT